MATQPSEEQGNSNHAESPADIEAGRVSIESASSDSSSIESASSESSGGPGLSEEEVDGPRYRPLLQAVFRGNWESAKRFFEQDPASLNAKITNRAETVLHMAALSAQDPFLENLIELLSPYPEALEEVDCDGRTALHNAVLCGRIRMVKALVRSNPRLTQIADKEGHVPLGMSALEASMHKEIAWFLAKSTTDDGPSHPFSSPSAINIIIDLSSNGHHDITLYLVGRYPRLLPMRSTRDKRSILDVLARRKSHFLSGTRLSVLEALICKCIPVDLNFRPTDENSEPGLKRLTRSLWNATILVVPIIKRVHEIKLRHEAAIELAKRVCNAISYMSTTEITQFFNEESDVLFEATSYGISEVVKLYIQFFPELIWIPHSGNKLTTYAVEFRQDSIVRLFLKGSSTNEFSLVLAPTMKESRQMLKEIRKCKPYSRVITKVAGAAFHMQRELQWYKAVEEWIIPSKKVWNRDGKTQWELFVEEHKELLANGEKWMKDTANSCMLVSTLIATVLFAAAFTVPGGNNGNTGVPLLLGQDSFLVFAISDALGLFSSVTAILVFLAILTSRYEPQDFLKSLPKKIIMGLSLLFLSLAFMLVAFVATLMIVLDKRLEWVLIPITSLAFVPVALFVVLQLPLLYQMVKSTYGPSIFCPESIWK